MLNLLESKCFKNEYEFGATVLRYAFGILFILAAVQKIRMGYGGFAEALIGSEGQLATEVPSYILYIYGLVVPGAELLAGTALLVHKYVREAFCVIALIYLSFIFGQVYDGNASIVGSEYLPSLIALTLASFFEERANVGMKRKK